VRLVEEGDSTAVCVVNDQIALGLLDSLEDHGIAGEMAASILGFDELPEAAHYSPPIPSIR
jgi:DNA-binding LacI/PurR family transcriptional regulator